MLGIIGGTGFYKLDGVELTGELDVTTPFGKPSAPLQRARFQDKQLVFLARHGAHHQFLPHEINYRANIFALKQAGVRQIVGVSAVGSLRQELAPGHFAIPTQYIVWVKDGRAKTFFGNGLAAHVSTAETVCPNLQDALTAAAVKAGVTLHRNKAYVCVDGPRFGTRAESHMLRLMGGDLVGMTNVPEAFLAREAQICYATLGIVTDYDCWKDDPSDHADTATIMARYGQCLQQAHTMLKTVLAQPLPAMPPMFRQGLTGAVLTPDSALSVEARDILAVLRT